MVKRTATIAVALLALSLSAFAVSTPEPSGGWITVVQHKDRPNAVPEPGDLLGFGTGLLLGVEWLRRKLSVR